MNHVGRYRSRCAKWYGAARLLLHFSPPVKALLWEATELQLCSEWFSRPIRSRPLASAVFAAFNRSFISVVRGSDEECVVCMQTAFYHIAYLPEGFLEMDIAY